VATKPKDAKIGEAKQEKKLPRIGEVKTADWRKDERETNLKSWICLLAALEWAI
jgi:hypothetical protein